MRANKLRVNAAVTPGSIIVRGLDARRVFHQIQTDQEMIAGAKRVGDQLAGRRGTPSSPGFRGLEPEKRDSSFFPTRVALLALVRRWLQCRAALRAWDLDSAAGACCRPARSPARRHRLAHTKRARRAPRHRAGAGSSMMRPNRVRATCWHQPPFGLRARAAPTYGLQSESDSILAAR